LIIQIIHKASRYCRVASRANRATQKRKNAAAQEQIPQVGRLIDG
jgi:hypothetical protein